MFGLKTLLPILAVSLPVLQSTAPRTVDEAIASIESVGGKVLQESGGNGTFRVVLERPNIHDEDLTVLAQFPRLSGLSIACPSITDKGLETISKLSQLKSLELRGTKISDEGIKEIAKLKYLEDLSLEDADVGDKGISYLKPMGKLRSLAL